MDKNSYWAAPRLTLGHKWEGRLTHSMLIILYIYFDTRITGSLVRSLGLKLWMSVSVKFKLGVIHSWNKCTIPTCFTSLLLIEQWPSGWIPNWGVPGSKPQGSSKVNSAFHPYEVDQLSTRNFWGLNGKRKTISL